MIVRIANSDSLTVSRPPHETQMRGASRGSAKKYPALRKRTDAIVLHRIFGSPRRARSSGDAATRRGRLTPKGVQVALLFLFFHKRLCGPLANSRFIIVQIPNIALTAGSSRLSSRR